MLYTVYNDKISISADTYGAELHSIKMGNTEYLWQCGDSWKRYAPLLFPFVCNATSKKYIADGVEYTMPTNHGFARDSEFGLSSSIDTEAEFVLRATDATKAKYPFDFNLFVKYPCKSSCYFFSKL